MRKNIVSICVLALLLVTFSVFGQEDRNKGIINSALIGLEYEVKAGFNIGGTAPIPLPVEIRDITGYNPTMAVAIEGNVTKWFDQEKKWGMRIGIRLDSKGMKTNAKTGKDRYVLFTFVFTYPVQFPFMRSPPSPIISIP